MINHFHSHTSWNHLVLTNSLSHTHHPFLWPRQHLSKNTKGRPSRTSLPGTDLVPPSSPFFWPTWPAHFHTLLHGLRAGQTKGGPICWWLVSPVVPEVAFLDVTPAPGDSALQLFDEGGLWLCWSPLLAPAWRLGSPWSLGYWLYSVTSSVTLVCSVTHGMMPGEASCEDLISPACVCQEHKYNTDTQTHINIYTHRDTNT